MPIVNKYLFVAFEHLFIASITTKIISVGMFMIFESMFIVYKYLFVASIYMFIISIVIKMIAIVMETIFESMFIVKKYLFVAFEYMFKVFEGTFETSLYFEYSLI